MKAKSVVLLVASLATLGLLALGGALALFLPGYIEREALLQMRARGLELESYELEWGFEWISFSHARGRLVGVKSVALAFESIDVTLDGREPEKIELGGVKVDLTGSAPEIALELGAWSKRFPSSYAQPLVASDIGLTWRPDPSAAAWLELGSGRIVKTQAVSVFSAQKAKVTGVAIGPVGATWTATGSNIAIGLGEAELSRAPLRVDVHLRAKPEVVFSLAPTKLERLAGPFGIELPVEGVTGSGKVTLIFPSPQALGPVTGSAEMILDGWVPPHPVELDGFVFGSVTTFQTKLDLSADLKTVTLSEGRVRAGKFELGGGGIILRLPDHAELRLVFSGTLPCPALAGAAAETRLGSLLGSIGAKLAGAAARELVQGSVAIEVRVDADSRKLKSAKLERKIGVGCGLKPLTLDEFKRLGKLLPLPSELSELADDLGKLPVSGVPGLPSARTPPGSAGSAAGTGFPLLLPPPLPLPKVEIDFGRDTRKR